VRRFRDRVAMVTGASSGIGEGVAVRLAAEGAKVVVVDIDTERGAQVAAQVDGLFLCCDVTDDAQVADSVSTCLQRFGRLDCYVANAGFSFTQGTITEFEGQSFDKTVALLLKGVAFGMKHAAVAMRAQGGGAIVVTSSVASLSAGMGPHIYSACKAAVNSLTRTVAFEEGSHGIRVNAVCPGSIQTPLPARLLGIPDGDDRVRRLDEAMAAAWASSIVLERRGTPADIAGAVAWLASDDAAYVTGQSIVVDGGLTLGKTLPSFSDWEVAQSEVSL
jgi:NAD(P)-dependent dehydrogenase (short-subunit alcohol dehydrogenase family)